MKRRETSRINPRQSTAEPGPAGPDDADKSAAVIRAGGIVAIPTETSYGLAVDPFNEAALERLFRLKERPLSKPVLVIIDQMERLQELVTEIPEVYEPLMDNFWPGPLTLIFPALPSLPRLLTAGTATIGVRISSNRMATKVCRFAGGAVTATSANLSARIAARDVYEIKKMFGDRIDLIVDGGKLDQMPPSTVLSQQNGKLYLIRAGGVPFSSLEKTAG